jgi:hypothetical protein
MGRIGCAGFAALLGAWLALAAPLASAAVYECKGRDGERVYSDSGCLTRGGYERPKATNTDPLQPAGQVQAAASREAAADGQDSETDEEASAAGRHSPRADGDDRPRDASLPRARDMVPGYRAYFLVGAVLLLLSYVLMFVSAFRDKLTAWGILLLLFSPLTMLIYPIFHWRRARVPFVMLLAGALVCAAFFVMPVDMITVNESYLTSRPGRLSSKKAATTVFRQADTIYLRTELEWDDAWVQTPHRVVWRWYAGDALRAEYPLRLHFDRSPFVLQGNLQAEELGPGKHRVEVFVDGRQLDARAFQVLP